MKKRHEDRKKTAAGRNKKGIRKSKLAFCALLIFIPLFLVQGPLNAATTQSAVISAVVDDQLSLDMTIVQEINGHINPTPLSSMDFGTLLRSSDSSGRPFALRGSTVFHVYLGANSGGRSYKVTSTMAPLVSSGVSLPNAAGVAPVAASPDGDPSHDIPGDVLAPTQEAVGTNKTLYTSNSFGDAAVLEFVYFISGGNADGSAPFSGWQPIPPGQAGGTYSTSVTFTITLT